MTVPELFRGHQAFNIKRANVSTPKIPETSPMQDRDAIIKKIQSLADTDLKAVADFLRTLETKKAAGKHKADALSQVIGICEGPSDLAEKHDRNAY